MSSYPLTLADLHALYHDLLEKIHALETMPIEQFTMGDNYALEDYRAAAQVVTIEIERLEEGQ